MVESATHNDLKNVEGSIYENIVHLIEETDRNSYSKFRQRTFEKYFGPFTAQNSAARDVVEYLNNATKSDNQLTEDLLQQEIEARKLKNDAELSEVLKSNQQKLRPSSSRSENLKPSSLSPVAREP